MTAALVVEPAALLDLEEASTWYDEQRFGLGDEFLAEVTRAFMRIEDAPQQYPIERGDVRKALVARFPFIILFVILPELITVIAVFHERRNPTLWHLRADL